MEDIKAFSVDYDHINTNIFPDSVKLKRYLTSAIIVASSKPCVDPSPRTKIFLIVP